MDNSLESFSVSWKPLLKRQYTDYVVPSFIKQLLLNYTYLERISHYVEYSWSYLYS
jgi:hypothetical protein